ncbi:stomatin-like protein 1 isoform X3 [Lagopus leucura]|uniref:stomatin-like protein 1 isoform X3 n=1 Tax=Lagopus leucura TaxID=30410 RepID=UPI001C6832F3|nr:stomatin-like protein 1 isoform X3 [Lagopus leucura]
MFSRSGYQALPLGDFDRFQQSSIGLYGAQKGFFSFGSKADQLGSARNAADSSQGWLSWICHGIITSLVFLLMLLTFPISGWFALKIVPTYERMVIFRLGRLRAPQGPGVVLLLPFIDHWQRVDLRTRAFNVPPCKLDINDMTKSWGLEVDRVELTMEAVLQPPRDALQGPLGAIAPVLEGSPPQLASHLLDSTPGAPEAADSVVTVSEVDPPRRRPSVAELLSAVEPILSEALVSQVGASYQVDIILPGGTRSTFFIDLSSGSGRAGCGVLQGSPDVVLEVAEEDLQELMLGELRPLAAYMSGRLRVQGDLQLALRLEELFKAMKLHR